MNPLIQLKTTPPLLIILTLLCFALSPTANALLPPPAPDGGYPGGNTAEGINALLNVNTGVGINNTAVGANALTSDTTGQYNVAVGSRALFSNTTGNFNMAVGMDALNQNKGTLNMAIGFRALYLNTTGSQNSAVGATALRNNTTGDFNMAIGADALSTNTTGNGNIALGANAGVNLTTGNHNIDIGNIGVAGESSIIRIGDLAVHQGIFLAGITAMSPEAPNQALLVDPATGQLGSADVTPEYAIVTVFVDRGNGPSRWAFYSAPLGSPAGTTTGGVFRFSCSAAQAPCKISYGAAVVSNQSTADATIHPRLLINKEDSPSAPITFCENADGANNNAGLARIPRVPTLADAVIAMRTPLTMGIGGTLDCGSTQPYTGVVTEIWVPASSNGTSTAFYDVSATFGVGLTLELPPHGP